MQRSFCKAIMLPTELSVIGQGITAVTALYIQGLALRFCKRRGYLVLMAWVQFNLAVSEADNWYELADVPETMIFTFIRRFGVFLPALKYFLEREMEKPYRQKVTDTFARAVALIPWPGHPAFYNFWPDQSYFTYPATTDEQFVMSAAKQHRTEYGWFQVRECEVAQAAATKYLTNLLNSIVGAAAQRKDTDTEPGAQLILTKHDMPPLPPPETPFLEDEDRPGTPSLPFIDDDGDYEPETEEECSSMGTMVCIKELDNIEYVLKKWEDEVHSSDSEVEIVE